MKSFGQFAICTILECRFSRIITDWINLCEHFERNHQIVTLDQLQDKVQKNYTKLQNETIEEQKEKLNNIIQEFKSEILKDINFFFEQIQLQLTQKFCSSSQDWNPLKPLNINDPYLLQQYIDLYNNPNKKQFSVTKTEEKLNYLIKQIIFAKDEMKKSLKYIQENLLQNTSIQQNQLLQEQVECKITPTSQIKENVKSYELQNSEQKFYQPQFNLQNTNYDISKQVPEYKVWEYQIQQINDEKIQEQSSLQQKLEEKQQQIGQNQIPLKNYKQQGYINNDRIEFQLQGSLNSENQLNNDVKMYGLEEIKNYDENLENDEIQNKEYGIKKGQKCFYSFKKFDISLSDKHLKYSSKFSTFSCQQYGFAVVNGIFNISSDDAKIKFRFTSEKNYLFQIVAQIGIITENFDRSLVKRSNEGKIYLDSSGQLFKQDKQREGGLQITINQDYYLSYRFQKRILMIQCQNHAEYIHIDNSIQGYFMFFVALDNLTVQIIR